MSGGGGGGDARERRSRSASQCYKGLRELGLDVESQEAFTAYCRAGAETFLKPDAALASACERCRIGRW